MIPTPIESQNQPTLPVYKGGILGPARSHPKRLLTALHLLCIACFASLLVWGLQGKTPINGDDCAVIMLRAIPGHGTAQYNYLDWTRGRAHIVAILYGNYLVSQKSLETGNLIWLSIYVLSAFAGYAYLRKIVSPSIALLGAIFYLGYSCKYEPLTWWSAGAYTMMWLAFFGLLRLLESRFAFRSKSCVVALYMLVSMYIYEVFTALAPAISLLLIWRRKREVGFLRPRDILLAALPTLAVLAHIAVLSTARTPIYSFHPSTINKVPVTVRVMSGFTSAWNATVGPLHQQTVKAAEGSFRHYYRKEHRLLNLLSWCAIVLASLSLVASWAWTLDSQVNARVVFEHASIGLFALVCAGAIGFVSNFCVTPSRLTGIPSIGLIIAACGAAELLLCWCRSLAGWRKNSVAILCAAAMAGLLYITVIETEAFSAILRQAGEVHDYDLAAAKQIVALHPKFVPGSEIFVRSAPCPQEYNGKWTKFHSGLITERASEPLAYLYRIDPGNITLGTSIARTREEAQRMQESRERWNKIGLNKVVPFYMDQTGKVFAVPRIVLTDIYGNPKETLDFSKQHTGVPSSLQLAQEIPSQDELLPNYDQPGWERYIKSLK